MMLEINQIYLSINLSIYFSMEINLDGILKISLKTTRADLSLSVNTSWIFAMNIVNGRNGYTDDKDRLFSNSGNKAGMKKVICEAKPIKSAFRLILQ